MTQKSLFSVDKGYSILESLTNETKAKELFEKYLLGEDLGDDINIVKLNIAFKGIEREKIVAAIARHALIYSCIETEAPLNETFVDLKNKLIEESIFPSDVVLYLFNNKELFSNVIKAFVAQRYDKHMSYRMLSEVNDPIVRQYLLFFEQDDKEELSLVDRIANFKLNASRRDLLHNKQVKINHKYYSLGKELHASIERGNNDLAQEDSVVIETHPGLKDFKLIAVADGESSKKYGEHASNYALTELVNWFDGLSVKSYGLIVDLKEKFELKMKEINLALKNDGKESATSFGCAIVGKSKTLISTAGDTRVYLIKSGKVVRETKDDSYVERLCDEGLLEHEKARFHKARCFVYNLLGTINDDEFIKEKTFVVDNSKYDKLLIMSDGVTKVVGNEKLEQVVSAHRNENITERLVDLAKNVDDHLEDNGQYCNKVAKAGEENATVAMYIKRR